MKTRQEKQIHNKENVFFKITRTKKQNQIRNLDSTKNFEHGPGQSEG